MSKKPLVTTQCKTCPFNGQGRVFGEGSRYSVVEKTFPVVKEGQDTGEKVIKKVRIYDNLGQYDVVAVGMAPAREELSQGRPFVGPSGIILRKTLEQMGITEYYLTNVLYCQITDDAAVPAAQECCNHKDRLINEVLARQPKLVIALGDLPLHTLMDTDYKIKEVEGRVLPSKVGPLLPLTHPAYYWRRPDEFFDFTECMRSGIKFLRGTYAQAVEPTYTEVTHENLAEVKQIIDRHEYLAVDLETTGFFAYGWEPDSILEMGLAVSHDHAYIVVPKLIPEFKEFLETKKGIYWNGQFDGSFLMQLGIHPNIYFDGMLAHYSIDERPYSHGLKRVARIYLGCDDWEKEIDKYIPGRKKKDISYAVIPQHIRWEYLAKDVTRTYQLKDVLDPEVNRQVFDKLLMPATRMFLDITHVGMRVDPMKMMEMDTILQQDLDRIEKDLRDAVGYWLNPNSIPQVQKLLYEEMDLPVDRYLGKTTAKVYLEQFRQDPIIDNIIIFREIKKMLGTYVGGFAKFMDKNLRIHPNIKVFGAVTGRLSSENPSIMNVKRDSRLKELFLPNVGEYLLYSDVKQNELRWYYVISGDETLGEVLKNGGDPHHLVASVAYGEDRADAMRVPAKSVVFGRLYKRGRRTIEAQVGSDVVDKLLMTVDGIFPEISNYYKDIMKQVRAQGYLESFFGRKRRFSLITYDNQWEVERQAVNFPIQSAGSDLMLLTMLYLWEVKEDYGIWPFWPYHDSITMSAQDKGVLPKIQKLMENYSLELTDGIVPFPWDMDWGYDWSLQKEVRV